MNDTVQSMRLHTNFRNDDKKGHNSCVEMLIFVNCLGKLVYQNLTDTDTFVMEVIITHPLFSKHQNSLQIQLFYDDLETANPLGLKRRVHKTGALYSVLRNLTPKFNSALMNIHLVALFHTEDLKKIWHECYSSATD